MSSGVPASTGKSVPQTGVYPSAIGSGVNPTRRSSEDQSYPPQKHAGAVGIGPQFNPEPTLAEKMSGFKDELIGKITNNHDRYLYGRDKITGDLKKRGRQESDEQNPFANADDDEAEHMQSDQSAGHGHAVGEATTSPEPIK